MNSLLTFCGQVLLSKAIAFFIQRNLGNACQRHLFLLYSYLSIHSPNAKANKTALYFWMRSFFFYWGCSIVQLHFSTMPLVT